MSENRGRMYRIQTYKKVYIRPPVFLKSKSGNEILVGMQNSDIMLALHPSWEDSISFSFFKETKKCASMGSDVHLETTRLCLTQWKEVGQLAKLISVSLETWMNGNLDSIKKLIFASFYHV